jgi:post-segregation antitoxin (ccd killing protein)
MSTMKIKVPDSLLKQARVMAEREDVTVEQLISSALAEKMAAWMTVDYLRQRAARGDRARFEQALGKVPDAEPEPADRL